VTEEERLNQYECLIAVALAELLEGLKSEKQFDRFLAYDLHQVASFGLVKGDWKDRYEKYKKLIGVNSND